MLGKTIYKLIIIGSFISILTQQSEVVLGFA
jgi:hypothetical protein